MKRFLLFLLLSIFTSAFYATEHLPNAWINEFHYDNASGDEGEAVEIVIENASDFNLELLTLEFHNGSSGSIYKSLNLKDSVACGEDGIYSFYRINYKGIQNGAPDGFSLTYDDHLIQFISYEGSFTATAGWANGQTSIDIGVEESGSTEIGQSLQLTGIGNVYSDFTWQEPASSTFCSLNNGQQFSVTVLNDKMLDKRVYGRYGSIIINSHTSEKAYIFDMSGRLISTALLEEGENVLPTTYKGLVLIRISSKVHRLVLR